MGSVVRRTSKKPCMKLQDLSDEQKQFVNMALAGYSCLVDACIGSGKTTAIQVLCNEMPSTKRILYLTYNKLLKVDAKNKIKNKNVRVTNYHGFAWYELRKRDIFSSQDSCIRDYICRMPVVDQYDLMLLDEYQDIDEDIAKMLCYIKSQNPGIQIASVGDMAQKLYDCTRLNAATFVDGFLPAGYLRAEFTKCFRISAEHAKMLGQIWGKQIVGVNDDCEVCVMDRQEAFQYALTCEPCDLLCLGKTDSVMRNDLLNFLEKTDPVKFNKNTLWSKINVRDSGATEPKENSGIFTTYDGCKGMERDVCIIFDWDLDYWSLRCRCKDSRYEILRNIFCVAASRGKRKIIFVKSDHIMLTQRDLMFGDMKSEKFPDVSIAGMFDFKYKEHVEDAYDLLEIHEIQKPEAVIDVPIKDGMIDLSPCIDIYQKAMYFNGYKIDKEIADYFLVNNTSLIPNYQGQPGYKNWTVNQKILYYTALFLQQNRYFSQVSLDFVTEGHQTAIFNRLSTHLRQNELVQQYCCIPFCFHHETAFKATGFADVVTNDCVYELKFVSELQHIHFLQCAVYMCAQGVSVGRLWNVRDNQMYEIRVPDEKKFLDKVVTAATKGAIYSYYSR